MKTALILPYFGTFPNYFNLHLHTIKSNPSFNWIIFTDDKKTYNYPNNVTVIYTSFQEIKILFQSKFNFEISLETPFKLCDYRPAFGSVFQDYLKEYDFWGHCDPDILWGNFDNFINYDRLKKFDKIFTFGHLTLYKNNEENNLRYLKKCNNETRYKTVFTNPIGFAFDEKFNKSINSIYLENNFSIYLKNVAADISPYYTNFKLSIYNYNTHLYSNEFIDKQLFTWENGSIFRYFIANNQLLKEEFLYIHLQKRTMKFSFAAANSKHILISPLEFKEIDTTITFENFKLLYKKYWFNKQFLKVKWSSFKYKLKYKDYFYGYKKNV